MKRIAFSIVFAAFSSIVWCESSYCFPHTINNVSPTLSPSIALPRAGINVEQLLAAGVRVDQFRDIFVLTRDYLTSNAARWHLADQTFSAARAALELASKNGVAEEIQTARSTFVQAESNRTLIHSELFAVVAGSLETTVAARLHRVHANAGRWRLPTKYFVKDRDEAAWIRLRDAITEVTEAQSSQRSPNPDALALVAAADADVETAAAALALENLSNARQAWKQAMRP